MTKQEYIRQTVKHLHCSRTKKGEIARQLGSHMEIALGKGRQLEEILATMGTPEALAGEFNENLGEDGRKWVKRHRLMVILAVVLILLAVAVGGICWMLPKGNDINDSKVFDAVQVRARAEEVIMLISVEDYETLDNYLTDEVRDVLSTTPMETAKGFVSEDWGAFRSFGNVYMTEIRQRGNHYAVVQANASYDNVGVTFTLTFNSRMELYGIYLK